MLLLALQHALAGAATLKTCMDAPPALPDGLDEVKKRVVRIENVMGSGSGTIISPDGFVLTAAHVVGTAKKVQVILADESTHEGEVVASDADADVALVRFDGTGLPCLSMADVRSPTGSDLFLMGSPTGKAFTHSVTKGIVSGYRDNDGVEVLQTDASLSPGYSGGPVLDLRGQVQGVISFKVVGQAIEGIGFATTSQTTQEALDLSFGDLTELDRAALPSSTKAGKLPEYEATIEITERPENPDGPLGKAPCYRIEFEAKKDPFTGEGRVEGRGADLFSYRMGEGIDPTVTFYAPLKLFYEEGEPQQPRLDIKLIDGTKIALTAAHPPEMMLSSIFTPTVAVEFPMTKELVATLASSGPTIQRWTYGRTVVDLERSERQRSKYFRPHFTCLLAEFE